MDLASKNCVATIPTVGGPHEVTVSPDGRTAVMCNYGSQLSPGCALTVIDMPPRKASRTIDLQQYRRPHGIAWSRSPTHDRPFVANIGSGSVSVIDLKTKQRVANIPSGAGKEGVDVSPDQREVRRIKMQNECVVAGPGARRHSHRAYAVAGYSPLAL